MIALGSVLGLAYVIIRDRNKPPVENAPVEATTDQPVRVASGGGYSGAGFSPPSSSGTQALNVPIVGSPQYIVVPTPDSPLVYNGGRVDPVWGGVIDYQESSSQPPDPATNFYPETRTDGVSGGS